MSSRLFPLHVVIPTLFLFASVLIPHNHANAFFSENGSWTTLDAPGSFYTRAFGVSGSNVVGDFGNSSGYHGFLYDGTTWTTLDAPGARSTVAYGIYGNKIVGHYNDTSGYDHGFLYNGTTWQIIDFPGATATYAYGISGNTIVGHYQDETGDHGFRYDGTTWQTLDAPGAVGTYAFGISGSNIVGRYDANGVSHGFLYNGTTWTTLDAPNSTFTDARGVSGGSIVGSYTDASGAYGFIRTGTQWSFLDAPSARMTQAYGIYGDTIVGQYNDALNSPHGFIFRSTSVDTGCNWDPAYGTQWDTEKKNLVVITHGWKGSIEDSWVQTMGKAICDNVDNSETAIKLFDWSEGAGTGGIPVVDSETAYYNAFEYAVRLYSQIVDLDPMPENIHLIAHSAGSNVIQTAVDMLIEHFASSENKPRIHLTFLDAYSPNGDNEEYGVLSGSRNDFALTGCDFLIEEGRTVPDYCHVLPHGHPENDAYRLPGYAEQYVTLNDAAWTYNQLKNATNFDVSFLNKDINCGITCWGQSHMWPIDFYTKSVGNKPFRTPQGNGDDTFYVGFPFAEESTQPNRIDPETTHTGKWCIITNVAEPYRRCLDQRQEERRDVILTDPNELATISGNGTLIDVGQFIGFTDGVASGTLPPITINTSIGQVEIPAHTTVTSSIAGWNGILSAPAGKTIIASEGITNIIDSDGKPLSLPTVSNLSAFEVGFTGGTLLFDDAVKMTLSGQAGRTALSSGLGNAYGTYSLIPDCSSVHVYNQTTANTQLGAKGDCQMVEGNKGNDLIIWTKHFTTFVTYEEINDTTPPVTIVSTSGEGDSTWYRSDVDVTLTATDTPDGSGVASTTYSLNDGATWTEYTEPFTVSDEGTHTVQYRSTDNAGNVEETKSVTFTIVSAQGLVEGAKSKLGSTTFGDKKVQQTVGVATQQLNLALKPQFWPDRNTLKSNGGAQVFAHLTGAVTSLKAILEGREVFKKVKLTADERTVIEQAIADILLSEHILAQNAVDAWLAKPGSKWGSWLTAFAQRVMTNSLEGAQKAEQNNNPVVASGLYATAWKHAQGKK